MHTSSPEAAEAWERHRAVEDPPPDWEPPDVQLSGPEKVCAAVESGWTIPVGSWPEVCRLAALADLRQLWPHRAAWDIATHLGLTARGDGLAGAIRSLCARRPGS